MVTEEDKNTCQEEVKEEGKDIISSANVKIKQKRKPKKENAPLIVKETKQDLLSEKVNSLI